MLGGPDDGAVIEVTNGCTHVTVALPNNEPECSINPNVVDLPTLTATLPIKKRIDGKYFVLWSDINA